VGALVGFAGVAATAAPGCADTTGSGSDEGEVESAREALTTVVPTCVTVQRAGASGVVADTAVADKATSTPTSYSTSGTVSTGVNSGVERRALFQFDLSAIPAGAVVTSADVTLHESNNAPATIEVHRLLAAWSEPTVTWQSLAGAFDPAVFGSFANGPAGDINTPSPVSFSVTALVQGWLDGTFPNDGILLSQAVNGAAATVFRTSEWATVAQRPALQICYTAACPAGYADCDGQPGNGCERALTTNTDCGGCGVPCALPHAVTSCAAGACAFVACSAGFHDCDGDAANGCESAVPCCMPSAEVCDGRDNDCNGLVDEGIASISCGVGACRVTVAGCVNGQVPACAPAAPGVEVCNGLDDDCNGLVDEGNPGGGQACSTGLLGACGAGLTVCAGGALSCQQVAQPGVEVCNGLDDDCDGQIDEGNPGGGGACDTGLLGVCAAGVLVCQGGGLACVPTAQPSVELPDGLDNDCNGVIDDGFACLPGQTQPCYSGPAGTLGVGVCAAGVQDCVGGQWGACLGDVLPGSETCDGLDNDCDGNVDNGLGTVSCGVGQCANTVPACVNGQLNTCAPHPPQPETCDGLDNDCDGVVDNGSPGAGAACSTGLLGVCAAGTTACVSGALQCQQAFAPSAEACDGLDNDCDGVVDNGNPGGGQACNTGRPGVCAAGTTACAGGGLACNQNVAASATEVCNGLDDNCNGTVDEGCVCAPNATRSCYTGPAGTQGVGICKAGTQTCAADGMSWGACAGQVTPGTESCHNQTDDNCNGTVNEGCSTKTCSYYVEDFDPAFTTAPPASSYYQASWCGVTGVPSTNMPSCFGGTGAGVRANGSSTSPMLWISKGATSCTSATLTYQWGENANSLSSLRYSQSNDTFANCSASTLTTAVSSYPIPTCTSGAQCASGLCGYPTSPYCLNVCGTQSVTIPFGSSSSVYIRFLDGATNNTAMWYDNVQVVLNGCDC
jgi:hypothetical protein